MKIKGLTAIFIGTLIITFWINFIDFKFNTVWIFIEKAEKLNSIIDNLSLSYIAGYIFYFLNVYLVERAEKKHILPFIAEKTCKIINGNNEIIRILKQDNKLKEYYPTVEEFRSLVMLERLETLKVFNHPKLKFNEYFEANRINTIASINRISNSGKYVDDELRTILFHLDESFFLRDFFKLDNENTYNFFFEYFQDIQLLNIYFNNNLKKYYHPRTYRRTYKTIKKL